MRRKQRYIRNAALLGGGLTAAMDILQQWSEHRDAGEKLTLQNYDLGRGLKKGIVGAAVGGGLGYLYYLYRVNEESMLPFDADEYLESILNAENLNNDPVLLARTLQCRDRTKDRLAAVFTDQLACFPENAGSLYKRTAILSSYDVDIILAFKKNAYLTLENMYYDVYEKLRQAFAGEAIITKQTRSIGMSFEIEGATIHIDVVPGREINNYQKDKILNLYIKPGWFWQRGSSHKADILQQQKITCNQPEARKIIKLLKIYRNEYGPLIPTATIEQCVVDALSSNRYGIYSSISENLLNCMDWLAQRLKQVTFKDQANSNNNLHKKLSEFEKAIICTLLVNDIRKVEFDSRYLKEIFEL